MDLILICIYIYSYLIHQEPGSSRASGQSCLGAGPERDCEHDGGHPAGGAAVQPGHAAHS